MPANVPNSFFRKLLKNQVVLFFLSAGVGFVVDVIVYYLMYNEVFHHRKFSFANLTLTGDVLSLIISYTCNIVCNFLLTKYFVFAHSKLAPKNQFMRFALVAFVGFFANLLLLRLFVKSFNMFPPVARIIAALSLGVVSYFVHKFFSFNIKKESK
ncbi:MAG: GtrA family protein [Sphingobacteriaceae bacterium]|nr:MAG: GtrA family protein [Sphingobacteriaceae bacterium]